jgi:transcription attenuation protein (tryptophan RNA-binding attenuator protein)
MCLKAVFLFYKEDRRMEKPMQSDYFVVKAKENGVHVIGLTRGHDTKFHHTEKLDKGEVMIAQFTEHTSAVKVRGKAVILTSFGTIDTEE